MKRVIKFRGKSLAVDEWVYGYLAYSDTILDTETCEELEIDEDTIGQFTGLLDKNGKDIYEGDILRCWEEVQDMNCLEGVRTQEYPNLLSVHFNPIAGGFFAQDEKEKRFFNIWEDFEKYEVVGNIHENLDLLK